jgi:hypothetical protein
MMALVTDHRAIKTKCGAGLRLAHIMRLAIVSNILPSSGGPHHFRLVTSFRRLASETSMPPNFTFNFHL